MNYPVVIYPCGEGGFVAEIPALKGCLAQGETIEETFQELRLVLQLWLEAARSHQQVLFIENPVHSQVIQDELNAAYKFMAEDIERETEAFKWAESLIGDVDRIDNEECWMISIVPIPNPDQAIRQHDAFLNGYAPEDEGLYDDVRSN